MPSILQVVIALSAGAVTSALADATSGDTKLMLTPSTSSIQPASAPHGRQLIEDLDRAEQPAATANQWVLAPLPFRNELLGAGLVLGAGYLYGTDDCGTDARHSVAAIAGMYAEHGSRAALGGHRGYWNCERYRSTLALAGGELLYDIELDIAGSLHTLAFEQGFSGGSLDLATKVGASGWIGAGFSSGTTDIEVRSPQLAQPEPLLEPIRLQIASLALSGELDTRDNDLYPRRGHQAGMQVLLTRKALGSDVDYETLDLEWNAYRPLNEAQVLAWRLAGKAVSGDVPFFAMAWFGSAADLRGYTPGRYIGEAMFTAQGEWRWQATQRWGLVAFAGAGKVSGALGDIDTDPWLPAAGLGLRLRLAKALPLNLRADFAWGRDDSTFSLGVGEAF